MLTRIAYIQGQSVMRVDHGARSESNSWRIVLMFVCLFSFPVVELLFQMRFQLRKLVAKVPATSPALEVLIQEA